jgi:O-antigen/teichoic acid export membrane protein
MSMLLALGVSGAATMVLTVFGREIIIWWTSSQVRPSTAFIVLMVSTVLADVPWQASANVAVAANRHHILGTAYVASTLLAIGATTLFAPHWGLIAVPISLFATDIVLTPLALPLARRCINQESMINSGAMVETSG